MTRERGREDVLTSRSWLLPQSTTHVSVVSPVTRNLTNPLGPTCVPPPFTSTWPHQQVTTNKHIVLFRTPTGQVRYISDVSERQLGPSFGNIYFISPALCFDRLSACVVHVLGGVTVRGSYSYSPSILNLIMTRYKTLCDEMLRFCNTNLSRCFQVVFRYLPSSAE